jgi:hypothetical protein
MIAYNIIDLDNREVQDQAGEAYEKKCISLEEREKIKAGYPCGFYTPNRYVRIGLFLLTLVIVAFSVGLLAFMILMANGNGFGSLMIFCGLVSYVVLEYMVRGKKHFRSGVDDGLLWMAVILLVSGLVVVMEPGFLAGYMIAFIFSFCSWLRYADRVMALVAYAALLGVVFYLVPHLGEMGKLVMSLVLMGVSAAVYFFCVPFSSDERARHYHDSLVVIKAACLISFYLAGNYFVVREAGIAFFNRGADAILPMGWLFWTLTIVTPLFYIYHGIQKKDRVYLWVGLGLIAATVYTIRHYYPILPIELAMTIGGILLILIAYVVNTYLKNPRHGFTSAETNDRHWIESLHIESLIIAETLAPIASPAGSDFRFGGGSGGGGAGGQY